ncbi:MraY family glycosyltransferase [Maioricimonas sp. JC845]|uniref:MraY family glycosyltransferase n=1 Tax=Maioricimonas sp. JC845 TaxID=3232138 RepID=UPI00345915DC
MLWFLAACCVPSFLLSFFGTAALRRLAPKWGLIDQPAARKVHVTPTPLGGGLAIYVSFLVTIAVAQGVAWLILATDIRLPGLPAELQVHLPGVLYRSQQVWAIIAAGALLAVMGLIDDFKGLPWQPRLAVQLGIAVALVSGGVRATVFVDAPWIGAVITVGWIVVLINAFNFLDNMDALSSGIALIASVLFATVMLTCVAEPRWLVAGALLVLAGSLGGFLCHNRPPATIFMGDSGSTFIGLVLATMTVLGTFYDESVAGQHVMLAPLFILAVPLYDFTSVMIIRIAEGRSPFHPDKSHFSHRLVELGLSRPYAVLTVHLATLTTGLGALLLYRAAGWTEAMILVAQLLCVLTIVAILETVGRRRNGTDPDSTG